MEKFSQCEVSRQALMKTGNNEIYEANPKDLFWGVGVALHSKNIWDVSKHVGKNVLGKCLQTVRNDLMQSA